MLLLVSGASGVGKTTARLHARHLFERRRLEDRFETAELFTLGPIPAVPTIAWRQEQVEAAVRRAIALEAEGRHLLFAGDPVPLGEVLAAPSADRIDVAACLLDVGEEAHLARLAKRDEPEALIPLHRGFATWLRAHATDPGHVPEAVTTDAWPAMRWERWVGRAPGAGVGDGGARHLTPHPRAGGGRGRQLVPACRRRRCPGLPGRLVPRRRPLGGGRAGRGAAPLEWRRAGTSR